MNAVAGLQYFTDSVMIWQVGLNQKMLWRTLAFMNTPRIQWIYLLYGKECLPKYHLMHRCCYEP